MPQSADRYEIRVQGRLDPCWFDWFEGLTVTSAADGQTILEGRLPDQAALHGVLNRIRDLNLRLISVELRE
jgi:hypothetical protein